jgi:hypothetical protein
MLWPFLFFFGLGYSYLNERSHDFPWDFSCWVLFFISSSFDTLVFISSLFFILVIVNSLKSAEAHQAIILMLESLQSLKLFSYYSWISVFLCFFFGLLSHTWSLFSYMILRINSNKLWLIMTNPWKWLWLFWIRRLTIWRVWRR